jgi:hypothetical protein
MSDYVCTFPGCIGDCPDCVDQEQTLILRDLVQRWINREDAQ